MRLPPRRRTAWLVAAVVLTAGLGGAAEGSAPPATGEVIVFQSKRDGPAGAIYLMFGDGSAQKRLFSGEGITPAWSPSGSRIAYAVVGLLVAGANGQDRRPLTSHLAGSFTGDYQPAWSPDGTRIAFTRNERGNNDIYVVGADGNGLTRLTTNPLIDYMPSWSPDGARIAFAAGYPDGTPLGNVEIAVINADGSGQRRLTTTPSADFAPDWSPDGSRIAFSSFRAAVGGCCNSEIYVMNAAGDDQQRITTDPAADWLPRWSPDGSRIAFASSRDGNEEIYVMNADGTGQTNLSRSPADDSYPDWALTVDLSVLQSVRPRRPRLGQALTYTMTIRNAGPGDATDVIFDDALPGSARVLSLTAQGGRCSRATGRCALAAIRAGATATVRLKVRPRRPGRLINEVQVSAGQIDPEMKNNSASRQTKVLRKKPRR